MGYPPEVKSSPLKNDGKGRLRSFGDGIFSGAMLNFQGVKITVSIHTFRWYLQLEQLFILTYGNSLYGLRLRSGKNTTPQK